ncbi:DUF5316 family protein [Salicibibacter kimchii]|uniref:DUF5316 domain-containing protein n=1 Tax=Salicibibacter kimchii TaxID=2099786 RepID=A0A345BX76_9BACI|nr:DUF5316 family protein [Salicibibacter kimchii]AXF55557.1 hypothetical protein DT065_05665 [Salicibibacter kimchii]
MGRNRDWFLGGLFLCLLIVMFSLLTRDISYIYTISGWISMVGIVLLGFLSGMTIKEEHMNRKKMNRDYQETAKEGSDINVKVFLFLLPHIMVSGILLYIVYF